MANVFPETKFTPPLRWRFGYFDAFRGIPAAQFSVFFA
jgi:hypothetical protein